MNCPKCQTPNSENASFCSNCATRLIPTPQPANKSWVSDTLIIIFLGYMFFGELARFAIQRLFDDWYDGGTKYIIIIINMLGGFSTLLLAFAIKNMTGRIIGIILCGIYIAYLTYSNISWMMQSF